jgi:polyphenol oxidase
MPVEPWPPPARRILSADAPPAWFAPGLARLEAVRHGFFGAGGGVSTGLYASLNAGLGSKDDPARVAENRRRIAAALGAEILVGPYQVHSPHAVFVDKPWDGARPEADAVVTTTRGLALTILTADCTPVLFADVEAGVIGAAHAGWRGALDGVLEATVALMQQHGARPERIVAAIGPCIHQASYEVGPDFAARFIAADAANARFLTQEAQPHFDLPGFCAARLQALGIGALDPSPRDTYADPGLFSHRRATHAGDPDSGRNAAAILLTA